MKTITLVSGDAGFDGDDAWMAKTTAAEEAFLTAEFPGAEIVIEHEHSSDLPLQIRCSGGIDPNDVREALERMPEVFSDLPK